MAAAEAAFPGITHLSPGAPVELTTYRTGHDTIPCGLFTNRAAARLCGSDLATRDDDRIEVTHVWIPEHSELADEPPAEDLSLFHPGTSSPPPPARASRRWAKKNKVVNKVVSPAS
ncbi:hypothetical protein ACWCPI_37375 [Streptomyces sp. NPDC001920]